MYNFLKIAPHMMSFNQCQTSIMAQMTFIFWCIWCIFNHHELFKWTYHNENKPTHYIVMVILFLHLILKKYKFCSTPFQVCFFVHCMIFHWSAFGCSCYACLTKKKHDLNWIQNKHLSHHKKTQTNNIFSNVKNEYFSIFNICCKV